METKTDTSRGNPKKGNQRGLDTKRGNHMGKPIQRDPTNFRGPIPMLRSPASAKSGAEVKSQGHKKALMLGALQRATKRWGAMAT